MEKGNQGVLKPPSVGPFSGPQPAGALCSMSHFPGGRASWGACLGLRRVQLRVWLKEAVGVVPDGARKWAYARGGQERGIYPLEVVFMEFVKYKDTRGGGRVLIKGTPG